MKKTIKLLEINRNQFVSPWFYKLIQTEYHVISIESSDFVVKIYEIRVKKAENHASTAVSLRIFLEASVFS